MQKIMGSSLRLTTSTIICNPLPTYLGKGLCVVVLYSILGSKSKGILCSRDFLHSARVSFTKYDKGGKTGL